MGLNNRRISRKGAKREGCSRIEDWYIKSSSSFSRCESESSCSACFSRYALITWRRSSGRGKVRVGTDVAIALLRSLRDLHIVSTVWAHREV